MKPKCIVYSQVLSKYTLEAMAKTSDARSSAIDTSGLSGTQEWALDWLIKNGPASKRQFKATGVEIRAKTMQSLVDRGLVYWDESGCAALRLFNNELRIP